MAIIVLASASGSPGVTTTAVGLTTRWDRPCMLLEADPTGASAMLAGYMRQYKADGIPGLFDLAVRYRTTGTLPYLLDVSVQPPDTTIRLISGLRSHTQVNTTSEVWAPLIAQLRELDDADIDVIVDLGRLGLVGSPTALLHAADLVLLVTRTTLPPLVAAANWAKSLSKTVGTGPGQVGLLLIGPGHPYDAGEVSKQLKLPVVTHLPFDPTTAEVFSLGSPPGRRFDRSPLYRSLPPAIAAIHQRIETSESLLQGESEEEPHE